LDVIDREGDDRGMTFAPRFSSAATSAAPARLPVPRPDVDAAWLDASERVAADGLAPHLAEMRLLLDRLGTPGRAVTDTRWSTLAHIILDAAAPAVARERAIGRLAALAARPSVAPCPTPRERCAA
jgi:hypothetical protein